MSDYPGSGIKLTNSDLDKDLAARMPEGLKVKYSFGVDKPILKIEMKDGEITEMGLPTTMERRNEGINWKNSVSIPLEVNKGKKGSGTSEKFLFSGSFKDETNRTDTTLLGHDTRYGRSGLGKITISEVIETDRTVSSLLE
jgi:predicted DNA-binding antitoxin AbrB/MazE fold protein